MFQYDYETLPPHYITLAPTQKCNLSCNDCPGECSIEKNTRLPFHYVNQIITDAYEKMGCRIVAIKGGEPFLYKHGASTLYDIIKKYNDVFFIIHTNGTLLTRELVNQMAESANVSVVISVDGLESHTNKRRGIGTFGKILKSFRNLREAGVPFGISIEPNQENIHTLLQDHLYDFFFVEQGVSFIQLCQYTFAKKNK